MRSVSLNPRLINYLSSEMGKGFSKKKKDKLTITTEVPGGASGFGSQAEAGQSSIVSKAEQECLSVNMRVLSDSKKADVDVMQEVLEEAKQMEAARAAPDDGYTSD